MKRKEPDNSNSTADHARSSTLERASSESSEQLNIEIEKISIFINEQFKSNTQEFTQLLIEHFPEEMLHFFPETVGELLGPDEEEIDIEELDIDDIHDIHDYEYY